MPTFLETLVAELGTDLDEQAQRSLLTGIDAVCSLSILHNCVTHKDQVRNPSAFVEKSVRNANPPGPAELENSLARLRQDNLIDDNALDVLQKGTWQESCHAVSALLGQDTTKITNVSAYVTRNVINARKQASGQPPIVPGVVSPALAGGRLPPQTSTAHLGLPPVDVDRLLQRWNGQLDQKAMDALAIVGPKAALEILQEVDVKSGTVRNPSAYVQRACENRQNGTLPGAGGLAAVLGLTGGTPTSGGGGHYLGGFQGSGHSGIGSGGGDPVSLKGDLLARYRGVLDNEAMEALNKVGPAQAYGILQHLETRAASVRNPSAYVVRSVMNLANAPGGAPGAGASGGGAIPIASGGGGFSSIVGGPGGGPPGGAGVGRGEASGFGGQNAPALGALTAAALYTGSWRGMLDDRALVALREVPPEVADAILAELESKRSVNNPSAYVCRAAANAKKGEGRAVSVAAAAAESNTGADSGWGSEGAWGGNTAASAYSCSGDPTDPRTHLDEGARQALAEIGTEEAQAILEQLRTSGTKVQNPSAYVLKAVGNARRGVGAGGEVAVASGRISGPAGCTGVLASSDGVPPGPVDLGPWRGQLDDEARDALEELNHEARHHILGELERGGESIRNPSAYVARAVANAKTGHGHAAWMAPHGSSESAVSEMQEELAKVAGVLDEKAMTALEEVGAVNAVSILRALNKQGDSVNNPNAYIMRAVGNEKRGGPPAKRPRLI